MTRLAGLALLIAVLVPCVAWGQGQPPAGLPPASRGGTPKTCNVELKGVIKDTIQSHFQSIRTPSGQYNTWYGSGVDARCKGTDQRLLADSAENYGDQKLLILIGNVHYTEKRVKMDTDRMTYYTGEERLVAEGNVTGVTNSGTRFAGPHVEYFRVAPGIRTQSKLIAESRPNIWISPKDASSGTKDSVHVQADRIISENDSLIYAKGKVIIDRSDLVATADSAFMDNGHEIMRLTQGPYIVGRGTRPFTLAGEVVDTYSRHRELMRVTSYGHAKATNDDITLTADSIDLRVTAQKLDRSYAWGRSRARAHSPDRDIEADSLDIIMPGQHVREMHALGAAVAETRPDSTKITTKEPDWLRGDTLLAHFDSLAATDSTTKPEIRQIVAMGKARSFYQVTPGGSKGKTTTPNVNYVTGRQITVDFRDRQVRTVRVAGKATGLYLEALPDSTRPKKAPASDSTASAATRPTPARGTKP